MWLILDTFSVSVPKVDPPSTAMCRPGWCHGWCQTSRRPCRAIEQKLLPLHSSTLLSSALLMRFLQHTRLAAHATRGRLSVRSSPSGIQENKKNREIREIEKILEWAFPI